MHRLNIYTCRSFMLYDSQHTIAPVQHCFSCCNILFYFESFFNYFNYSINLVKLVLDAFRLVSTTAGSGGWHIALMMFFKIVHTYKIYAYIFLSNSCCVLQHRESHLECTSA